MLVAKRGVGLTIIKSPSSYIWVEKFRTLQEIRRAMGFGKISDYVIFGKIITPALMELEKI